jgi:hypothetical protein
MRWWPIALVLAPFAAHGQPCCGPITPQGRQLERFLDDSGVDHLWVTGWHIDWRTRSADRQEPGGREAETHCSAFVAAMAERLRNLCSAPTGAFAGVAGERSDAVAARSWRGVLLAYA